MRLPSARAAVGIYALLVAIATIPRLTDRFFEASFDWGLTAIAIPATLVPAALFLAAIAIDDRWAFAVPIVALVARTVVVNLFSTSARYDDLGGLAQITLRHDLWEVIKFDIPVALIIVALALAIARAWEPWVSVDRIVMPSVNWPALALVVTYMTTLLITIAMQRAGLFHGYVIDVISSLSSDALSIAFFTLCAVAFSPWILPLPIFMATQLVVVIVTSPGFSCGRESMCGEYLWPASRSSLLVWTGVMVLALAAGWWARRGASESAPPAPVQPAPA